MEVVRRDGVNGRRVFSSPASRSSEPAMRFLTRENLIAVLLCLLVILLIVVTTDSAPQWIYQGF